MGAVGFRAYGRQAKTNSVQVLPEPAGVGGQSIYAVPMHQVFRAATLLLRPCRRPILTSHTGAYTAPAHSAQ